MISIILPTYKNAPFLNRAIDSVIAQTLRDWELIVIDDGLSASAQSVVEDYVKRDTRIICIKNETNLGIQQSLNRGIVRAVGTYIARIDDDDIWIDRNKLSTQVTFLEEHTQYVLVGTNASIVREDGGLIDTYHLPEEDVDIRARILSKNCFLHPTIVVRKDAIQKAGGYPESLETKHIEDYALWLTLGTKGKFANLPAVTTALSIHERSLTFQNRIVQAGRMRALIHRYKCDYPRFLFSYLLLSLRIVGFSFLEVVPMPKSLLYRIQKVYKEY